MTHFILKSISYVFHPLLMPLLGVLFYFHKSPRFIPEPFKYAKLFSISILTIILPILLYFLLKTVNKVNSLELKNTKERIFPLLINCIILLLILYRVFTINEITELYFYFLGLFISTFTCLVFVFLKIKASIHMLSVAACVAFCVCLGVYYKININGSIALMVIITGAVATSRLHLKAHTPQELILGLLIGITPQLLLIWQFL